MVKSRIMRCLICIPALVAVLWPMTALAQKKPLDPSVFDGWNSVRGVELSRDGHWLAYSIASQEGDATGSLRNVADAHIISIPRAASIRFTKDSKFAVALVPPPFAELKKAREDKAKPEDLPKSQLVIVNLATGEKTTIDRVQSFELSAEDSGWIVYRPEPPKTATPPASSAETPAAPGRTGGRGGRRGGGASSPAAAGSSKTFSIVVRKLDTGKEETLSDVSSFVVDRNGDSMAYAVTPKPARAASPKPADDEDEPKAAPEPPAPKPSTLDAEYFPSGSKHTIVSGQLEFPQLTVSNDGKYVAYYTRPAEAPKAVKPKDAAPKAPIPASLFVYEQGQKAPIEVGKDSIPKDWVLNDKAEIHFSDKATRLVYSTYPAPPAPAKELPDDEKVSVDIWNWQDPLLQTEQLLQVDQEARRGYTAVYDLRSKRAMQICDKGLPNLNISDKGDGRFALAATEVPYRHDGSWDPGHEDVYLVDLNDGSRTLLSKYKKTETTLSPEGKFVAMYDQSAKSWSLINTATKQSRTVGDIPYPLFDELADVPDLPPAYGLRGWLKGDAGVLVADRFDLWLVSTDGKTASRRLTSGRDRQQRYTPVTLDAEHPEVDPANMLLTAFNESTKQGGIYWIKSGVLSKVFLEDKTFGGVVKAKDSDRLVYTRQDFVEFPDLWLTDLAFNSPTKVTEANPQQAKYLWGKAELVQWTSLDGVPLQGILIKPDNFDYGKKYPMITYFYERLSESLYSYHAPAPSASTINLSYFASNGYCIFVPDIPYRVGNPGYSALSAVVPGVQSIVSRGYIDPTKLGIQGQSWGGYQVAYLVTQTNMFAAAEAGAPVGDMFSAYGGIRYGSGVVREMQYEHGQSRIGGTPWDSTLRYIENSPVFFADKVDTPLMIMSNDKDGAVPHTQGIELFTALRRLGKPSWMVVYNGEDHNIVERKNRKDFTIRLSQFFDHFLKGAPMPVWMSKGVPAVDKGRTMGLDLDTDGK
jgi:dipeptidyl aminopeptidase/acylaminoacyl peptidase